jgi:hypothetical protein
MRLVPVGIPAGTSPSGKELQIWSWTAGFNNGVKLIGHSAVFLLLRFYDVHLSPSGLKGSHVSAHAEEHKFRRIPEIETNPASIYFAKRSAGKWLEVAWEY